jgi:hypothetical protein
MTSTSNNQATASITAIQATSFENRIMLKLENMEKHFEKLTAIEKSVVDLTSSVEFMNRGFEDMRDENKAFKEEVKGNAHKLQLVVAALQEKAEQRSRNDTIRIVGIAENRDENCEEKVLAVLTEILPTVAKNDISIAHRIGRRTDPNRAIIVTLTTRKMKEAILKNKKALKGKPAWQGVYINEDLTQMRVKAAKILRDTGQYNVHTKDGKVVIVKKGQGDQRPVFLNTFEDIIRMMEPQDAEILTKTLLGRHEAGGQRDR